MARERGFLDARMRAFIALRLGSGHANLQVDTGFNAEVLIGNLTAAQLGVVPETAFIDLYPAGSGSPFRARIGHVDVAWLGQFRRIDVLVYENEQPRARGEPDGLLGTGLIHPNKLTLDYLNDIVEIST